MNYRNIFNSFSLCAAAILSLAGCGGDGTSTESCGEGGSGGGSTITITIDPPTTSSTATILTCAGCTLDTFDGECVASTTEHCGIDGAICSACSGVCLDGSCNPCQKQFCGGADCKVINIEDGSPCENDMQCFDGVCSLAP